MKSRIKHFLLCFAVILSSLSGMFHPISGAPIPELEYKASEGYSPYSNTNGDLWTYEYVLTGNYESSAYVKFTGILDDFEKMWCVQAGAGMNWEYGRIGSNSIWPGYGTYDVSRTFNVPQDGIVSIGASEMIRIWNGYTSTDGVNIAIYKNNVKIWPQYKSWQLITNAASLTFENIETSVREGDNIHFRVNKNGDNEGDQTLWNPTLTYIDDEYDVSKDLELIGSFNEEIYNASEDYSFESSGNNGDPWEYQYVLSGLYENSDYINFTYVYPEGTTGFWCWNNGSGGIDWSMGRIGVNTIWPAGNAYDLSRTFTVPHDGVVEIDAAGGIRFLNNSGRSEIAIFKNGVKIWPGGEAWQQINNSRLLNEFPVFETSVKEDDKIQFRARYESGTPEIRWVPVLSYTGNVYNESLDKAINPLPQPTIGKKYQASTGYSIESNNEDDIWNYEYAHIGNYEASAYEKYINVFNESEHTKYWCIYEGDGPGMDWALGRIGAKAMFPGWSIYDVVRTFTVPHDGVVEIAAAGLIKIWDGYASADGVNISIYKNGVKIWPQDKEWGLITDSQPLTFAPITTAVLAGDKIHFRANKNINEQGDQFEWDQVLTYTDDVYYSDLDLELHNPSETLKEIYNFENDYSSVKQGPEWYYGYSPFYANYFIEHDRSYNFGGDLTWAVGAQDWTLGAISSSVIQPGYSADAVLAFKAPVTGIITVSMKNNEIILPLNSEPERDGINVKIQRNQGGVVSDIWPSNQEWQHLSHTDPDLNRVDFEPLTLNVRKGEYIYIRTNMGANNWNDNVRISPVITYDPDSVDLDDAGYGDSGDIIKGTDDPGADNSLLPEFNDDFDRSVILNGSDLIDHLNANISNSVIDLPEGVYKIESNRLISLYGAFSNKTINAEGVLLIVENPNFSAVNFEGINNTVIKGLTIEYSYLNQGFAHSVIVWNCTDLTLENFTLLGGSGNGIQVGGNSDGIKINRLNVTASNDSANNINVGVEFENSVKNVSVENSVIANVNVGISIKALEAVINNTVIKNATDGIKVLASDADIRHTTFSNISNYGIEIIAGIQNTLAAKNIFSDTLIPICSVGTLNTVIECNIFEPGYDPAIYDDGTQTLSIISNDFRGMDYPVKLKDTSIAIINNNTYTGSSDKAFENIGGASQIVGNEIPGVLGDSDYVGADESKLPQIDKNRFIDMERKTTIDGKSMYQYIMEAYSKYDSVIIPPGAYAISGSPYAAHLAFANMKDFTIYAYGVFFEFENYNGSAFSFTGCENISLLGLTMDYKQVANLQGTITGMTGDGKLIWTADTGYVQDLLDESLVQYNQYGGNSGECYAEGSDIPYADTGWNKNTEIQKISDGVYSLTSKSSLQVGSKVIFRGRFAHINIFSDCKDMRYEDVTVFSGSGFGFMESNGEGNSQLNRVAFTPGPIPTGGTVERLISTCDATHAVNMRAGMKVTNCLFEKMTDDATNNCGTYGTVADFNTATYVLTYTGGNVFRVGDRALIYTLSGKLLCDAEVTAVSGRSITLNKTFVLEPNAIVENASSNGNGFLYENCVVQNNRSRGFLIKSPYGVIKNCTLKDNGMSSILIAPEIEDNWGECGFSWDIQIINNRFIDGGFFTGSELHSPINVTGDSRSYPNEDSAYYNHSNILIQGNSFEGRYTKYCINANSVNGLKIIGNTFGITNSNARSAVSSLNNTQEVINIQGAMNIIISDNIYPDSIIGEKINIGKYVKNISGTDVGVIASDFIKAELAPYYNTDSGKWQIKVVLTNVAGDGESYSGTFGFISPIGITYISNQDYPAIVSGGTYELYFDVDLTNTSSNAFTDIVSEYTVSNGGKSSLAKSMSFLNADYSGTTIDIDGILNEDIWVNANPIDFGNGYYFGDKSKPAKEAINSDILSGIGKFAWDDEYIYFSTAVTDITHYQAGDNSSDIWSGDSIQLTIGIPDAGFAETGFALHNNGNVYQHCWQYTISTLNGQGTGIITDDYAKAAIIRDDENNTTVYEIAINWSFFGVDGKNFNDSDSINIGMVINNSNGSVGDRVWIEYFGGIASGEKGKDLGYLHLSRSLKVNEDMITINFEGVEGVKVEYYTNVTGWKTVAGTFDNSSTFAIPKEDKATHGATTIRVGKGGMTYSFTLEDGIWEYDIPVSTITVTGIGFDCNLSVVGSNWVYQNIASIAGKAAFNVFGGRTYELRISKSGFDTISIPGLACDGTVDISSYFYEIAVPETVSNIRLQSNNWIVDYLQGSMKPGNVIDLLKTGKPAKISFVYDGEVYDIEFTLDGTNPFDELSKAEPVLVSASTSSKSVKIVENSTPKNTWTVTFVVRESYSDGTVKDVEYTFAMSKNGNGSIDLGNGYTLIYDIKGNGSNIKKFELKQN